MLQTGTSDGLKNKYGSILSKEHGLILYISTIPIVLKDKSFYLQS